jgi:2-polyprenyl-6-methoxyphenol hydroxylase-like FAD-dependent oxidoreductase
MDAATLSPTQQTTCAIVGGGPAGAVLAYILADKGIDVTLLEAHHDFDRDFRGDTLHPSTLEVMDELGLAEKLLQLPHTKLSRGTARTPAGSINIIDLSHLKSKFPYIALMPQARFLEFLTREGQRFANFHLLMGAHVNGLVEENGAVCGVRYKTNAGVQEMRALLTVGADGRFSSLRKLSGLGETAIKASQPMDVLWFRLSRKLADPHGLMGRFGQGFALIQLERETQWQIGLIIPKGAYKQLHTSGLDTLRKAVVSLAPELTDRIGELSDWKQISLLSVEADRLKQWYKPGLLLIGDAAHVMSPAWGNGINYAIMDAVAAANILSAPLQSRQVTVADLARVQKRRQWPTQIVQALVNLIQNRVLSRALDPNQTFTPPQVTRWPILGKLVAQLLGFGIQREHVKS